MFFITLKDALHSDHTHLSTHVLVSPELSCWIFMQFGTAVLDTKFWSRLECDKKWYKL